MRDADELPSVMKLTFRDFLLLVCLVTGVSGASAAAPANDDFASATVIGANTLTESVNIVDATSETGEPLHAGIGGKNSAWWSFTTPSPGRILVDTAGSDFDTVLAAYTGSSVDGLSVIQSNDDAPGLGAFSRLHFLVDSGVTIHIAVDHHTSFDPGTATFNFQFFPDGNNDDLADALVLTGNADLIEVTNVGGSRENGEATHVTGQGGGASIWFEWTAPSDGSVTVTTKGSLLPTGGAFDTMLAIYTGTPDSHFNILQIKQDDNTGATSPAG